RRAPRCGGCRPATSPPSRRESSGWNASAPRGPRPTPSPSASGSRPRPPATWPGELMFTGIVEELGRFEGRDGDRYRFGASTVLDGAGPGAPIAVNGTCLTVVEHGDGWWVADVSDETAARTNLGALAPGDPVNFERPVRMDDRLGGHVVLGHVDAVGRVVA